MSRLRGPLGPFLSPTVPATLEEAARIVAHHDACDLPMLDCPTCLDLAKRADRQRGSMDVAIADLRRLLPEEA